MISLTYKRYANRIIKPNIGGWLFVKRPPTPLARLRKLYDPLALCYGLTKQLARQPCVHDFTQTRALLAHYAPQVDADALIALVQEMGAHCDCEILNNVCVKI